jgi:hypothetical protein
MPIRPGSWCVQFLERKADDPAAFIASWVNTSSFRDSPITCTPGKIRLMHIVASTPPTRGMFTSIITTCGASDSDSSIAARPSPASPTTMNWANRSNTSRSIVRNGAKSSTIRMGIGFARSAIAGFKKHLEGYRSGFILSPFLISVCSKQDAPQKMR